MKVQVCTWKTCSDRFSQYIIDRLEKDKNFYELKDLEVDKCPCTWNCKIGPSVIFDGTVQTYMNPITASDIIRGKKEINKNPNNKDKKKK